MALAAALQVDAVVPNFLIQEQIDAIVFQIMFWTRQPTAVRQSFVQSPNLFLNVYSLGDGLLREPWLVREGHIDLPTRPGLGFEIDEHAAEQNRVYEEELGGEFYHPSDGSVADW